MGGQCLVSYLVREVKRGGGGRWRRNPVPPFAERKAIVVRVAMRGECVVSYVVRKVRRGATLVLGELVAITVASSVRVPSPSLVRPRRHLGRAGEGVGRRAPGGGAEGGLAVSGTQA